ncbi:flagellar type III secretion system pore protein FliP [Myxococcota bacterium]|nr:flagellar type III secretion system pore protein FliP [Myxococcota bacterium]MBU1429360.1 flagellar type III secretion system pore protein FliP [Myxococcota bacterium]MBU1899889.1 flagellar type III secretion system pore protein FliP [Myxococcota bacterium]
MRHHRAFALLIALLILLLSGAALAQAQPLSLPKVQMSVGGGEGDWVGALRVMALLTILTLAPSILLTMTSFTRIVIVLSFMRQALGTQQSPPNQVLVALALFLSVFIMQPVWSKVHTDALAPFMAGEINQTVALERAQEPVRAFMFKHTRQKDLGLFIRAAGAQRPKTRADVSTWQLIPAFIISELRTAFQMGFMLYVPFLVMDMVVASILMAMGMMMLPPILISLPFKIMLFVLVDGWNLLVTSLIESFQ